MLRIKRLRVEIKTSNEHRGGVYGFDRCFSDGLNFIASSENTSGKSSVIEAILYGLGLEQIIGGTNERALTSAYKSQIKDGNTIWNVLESGVFLEISNGNETVTIFRSATMEGRDSRLVTVYYGDYNSIGKPTTLSDDMYLHDKGAATNEKGFHTFLESFLHLELPLVQTGGNDQKLYLQTIFSCIFIEQKHGWSDLFSGMPYLGIKDAKKRVVEFLIGLDTYKVSREKDKLKAIKNAIMIEWQSVISDINRNANRENCMVRGLPVIPKIMTEQDYSDISVCTMDKKILEEAIWELKVTRTSIKKLKPRVVDNFDTLNAELISTEESIEDFETKLEECRYQSQISRAAIAQSERSLEIVLQDLRNNKDAATLQKMGAVTGCKISTNICPTCNQAIHDSLLHMSQNISVMSIEENIRHLEGQKAVLEFNRDSHKSNLDNLTLIQNDIQSRLVILRRLAQSIRSDLFSTETEWSETIVQKLVEIESILKGYDQLKNYIVQQLDVVRMLSKRWEEYKEAFSKLPDKSLSTSDIELMAMFKDKFISNLRKYKYKSAPDIDAVDIPIDTCLPSIHGFDMKFDSSASDNIRIIWSFTMALLQTSIENNGNHPRIVIFDEPAQHSIVTSDMDSLVKSILELKKSAQVIIGITLNNEELKETIMNLSANDANVIEIDDRAFKLL